MKHIWADDVAMLWRNLNLAMTGNDPVYNQFAGDHFLNLFDIVLESSSHKCPGITLESLAYTEKKAKHLLRSYLDPNELNKWVTKLKETTESYGQVDSDIILQTKRESKHGNGPCLLGFSFRSRGGPHLTIYSRSAELPQLFGADCLLASSIGNVINEALDKRGVDISVTWFCASSRIKSRMANLFRIFYHPETITYSQPDFQKHIDKGWEKFLVNQHPVTFTKLRRLQEAYARKMDGVPMDGTGEKEFTRILKGYMKEGK